PGFRNGNGLGVGTLPGAAAQPGIGGGVKPQKPGEPHPVPRSLPSPPSCPSPPLTPSCSVSPGPIAGNGLGAGAFPGAGAQPGEGARAKLGCWGGGRGGAGEGRKLIYGGDNGGLGAGVFPEAHPQPGAWGSWGGGL
ncbi:hypothetical protein G4228_007341, partial [Cervus hanglu yarkandensis]